MTIFFVSRHPGAREWARELGVIVDRWVDHLELNEIQPGDSVLGTLPVHLAAAVCERGAAYWHLSLDLPVALRGRELTDEELCLHRARLEAFDVRRLNAKGSTP